MRILQICNRIPYPPKDGGAIGIYNFVKCYHELGNDLTVLAFNTLKHHRDPEVLPTEFTSLADIRTVDLDTNISPWGAFLNLFSKKSYNVERFRSQAVRKKLAQILKEKAFDIIHLDSIYVAMYLDTIRQYSDAKVIFRAHNIEYLIWERLGEVAKPGPKKWYLRLLAKRLKNYETNKFPEFDAILPISNHDWKIINQYSPNVPKHLTTAGVNLEDYNPSFNHVEFPTLFHLGSLDWMPNQEAVNWFLNQIWPEIYQYNPECRFFVAGRNMPEHFRKYRSQNVQMIGEVENALDFMNAKAIMVVPLLSGSGMRLKILEGMAMGKCVISTSIGAEGIHYEDGKNILIADDKKTFIQKILDCLANKDEVFRIGQNAIELVRERYTNQRIVKDLMGFYEKLANQKITA